MLFQQSLFGESARLRVAISAPYNEITLSELVCRMAKNINPIGIWLGLTFQLSPIDAYQKQQAGVSQHWEVVT